MRNFNSFDAVRTRIADEALSLVYCFLLQLRTGEQFFYTEGSQSVTVEGSLYRADPGITVSSIRDGDDAAAQTGTIEIGYSDDGVTEELVRKGGLDGATFNLGMADYRDRTIPFIEIFSGHVDRVTASNPYSCSVDLTGWQVKTVNLPGVYSLKCRNVFCDKGCTLDINDHKHPFTMLGDSTDSMTFRIDQAIPEGLLKLGTCEWQTGRNAGVRSSIAFNSGDQVKLMSPTPYVPVAGDTGVLTDGCDFYADTCQNTYNNLVNMKAEPAVPQGADSSIEVAKATQYQDPYKPDPAPQAIYNADVNAPLS
jgi:uncharacterized phage protein (TIGR02218 family)